MIFATAANDGIDVIAVALRIGKLLEEEHPHALARHIAVGILRERLAPAIAAQRARLAVDDVGHRRQHRVHAARQRHLAIAGPDRLYRTMECHERAGTGRLHRFARPVHIEEIAHAARPERRHARARAVALEAARAVRDHEAVVAARRADEDAGLRAGQGLR